MNVFHLTPSNLPRLVIDDTAADAKYIRAQSDVSTDGFEAFILESLDWK
jgi:hypothetical protein